MLERYFMEPFPSHDCFNVPPSQDTHLNWNPYLTRDILNKYTVTAEPLLPLQGVPHPCRAFPHRLCWRTPKGWRRALCTLLMLTEPGRSWGNSQRTSRRPWSTMTSEAVLTLCSPGVGDIYLIRYAAYVAGTYLSFSWTSGNDIWPFSMSFFSLGSFHKPLPMWLGYLLSLVFPWEDFGEVSRGIPFLLGCRVKTPHMNSFIICLT
jgi:hypothetical protein